MTKSVDEKRFYRGMGISLHASFQGGEMITKPLVFKGDCLMVNFSTSAAGSLKVEIQDSSGRPVEGYALSECTELYGDRIEQAVVWNKADVASLAGQPIRLRFALKDADVFAFGFHAKP